MDQYECVMDEFDEINSLMRDGRNLQALARLIDNKGRVRDNFRTDLNHAWYLAGNAAYDAGKIDSALQFFKNSAKAWPSDTQALMAIAYCYSDLNKPRWAAHYLSRAIKIDPSNPDLFYNLANARFDMAQYAEAAKLYRKAIKAGKGETKKWAVKNLKHALSRMQRGSKLTRRGIKADGKN